jgi:hypothetical protein
LLIRPAVFSGGGGNVQESTMAFTYDARRQRPEKPVAVNFHYAPRVERRLRHIYGCLAQATSDTFGSEAAFLDHMREVRPDLWELPDAYADCFDVMLVEFAKGLAPDNILIRARSREEWLANDVDEITDE